MSWTCGWSSAPLVLPLLLCGAVRPRDRLEPRIGDRLAALDREPVRALVQSLLRALDRLQLLAELLGDSLPELLVEQLGRGVGRMLVEVRQLGRVLALGEAGERALDPCPLPGEEITCPIR
jgi:hypothetical protein